MSYFYIVCKDTLLSKEVESSLRMNVFNELPTLSQNLRKGAEFLNAWAIENDATFCDVGYIVLRINQDKVGKIKNTIFSYEALIGSACHVGIGSSALEGFRAYLTACKLGRNVVFYSQAVEEALKEEKEAKQSLLSLDKAELPIHRSASPILDSSDSSESSEDSAFKDKAKLPMVDVGHYSKTLNDLVNNDEEGKELEDIRNRLSNILLNFKNNSNDIKNIKATNPGLYDSIVNIMATTASMAKRVLNKSDDESSHIDGEKLHDILSGKSSKWNPIHIHHEDGKKVYFLINNETGKLAAAYHDMPKDKEGKRKEDPKLPGMKLKFKKDVKLNKEEELPSKDGKMKKSAAKNKAKRVTYPVGTVMPPGGESDRLMAGKMKIQHEDGSKNWVQLRQGMIRSHVDPNGHPISVRNPKGR